MNRFKLIRHLARLLILFSIIQPVRSLMGAQDEHQKRKKVIDFEGELVEGVNRKSLDSLSQISESKRKKSKPHLYKKRKSFRNEISENLKEMR